MSLPSIVRTIKEDLDDVVIHMVKSGIADDQNLTFLRQIGDERWEITFEGSQHVSLALGNIEYDEIHRELVERRCYSVKLLDGGILHFQYMFEADTLQKHRLAYLPSPKLKPFREDPIGYVNDEMYLDIVSRRIVPFPIRFDYDSQAAQAVSHPACHLTLGEVKGCRIPVSNPLTPRWFVEFVLGYFYRTDKYEFVSCMPSHRHDFAKTITMDEERLIHVKIPIGVGS